MQKLFTIFAALSLMLGAVIVQPTPVYAAPSAAAKAKAKESKADSSANVEINRDVIQSLEHAKKQLESEKGKDVGAHRATAVKYIQEAMGAIRSQTSTPGH
jgi:hypothetical protein